MPTKLRCDPFAVCRTINLKNNAMNFYVVRSGDQRRRSSVSRASRGRCELFVGLN